MSDLLTRSLMDLSMERELKFPVLVPRRHEAIIVPARNEDGIEGMGLVLTANPVTAGSTRRPQPIRWASGLTTMFDSLNDLLPEEAVLLETGMTRFANLPVLRIGLRHMPDGPDRERRTVAITNLPACTTLDQVLRSVRGGEILTSTICDTVRLTGGLTALITFVNSSGAAMFMSIVKRTGFFVGFQKAEVNLIASSTYPMRRILQDRIVNRGRTRALTIQSTDPSIRKTVHNLLSNTEYIGSHVEGFKDHRDEQEVTVLFYSIEMAMRAFKVLQDCPDITKMWFATDPSARGF